MFFVFCWVGAGGGVVAGGWGRSALGTPITEGLALKHPHHAQPDPSCQAWKLASRAPRLGGDPQHWQAWGPYRGGDPHAPSLGRWHQEGAPEAGRENWPDRLLGHLTFSSSVSGGRGRGV